MKKLRFTPLWLSIGFVYILLIFYGCLRQTAPSEPIIPHLDKVIHSSAYLILGFWFSLIYKKDKQLKIFLLCTAQGIMIEYLQGLVGYRSFEYADMIANASGAIIGCFILARIYPNVLLKIEEFFIKE